MFTINSLVANEKKQGECRIYLTFRDENDRQAIKGYGPCAGNGISLN